MKHIQRFLWCLKPFSSGQVFSSLWPNWAVTTHVTLQRTKTQNNLSQLLCLSLSCERSTSSHFQLCETNVSTRHKMLCVQISSLMRVVSTDVGIYHMCKMSLSSWSHIQQPALLNAPSKSAIQFRGKKKSPYYHMRWLKSKANTPTGVHTKTDDYRTAGLASKT